MSPRDSAQTVRIQLDEKTRFIVHVRPGLALDDTDEITLMREYRCFCQSSNVRMRESALRKGTNECIFCEGALWRSSPDEGTSIPAAQLDELITVLQVLQSRRRDGRIVPEEAPDGI